MDKVPDLFIDVGAAVPPHDSVQGAGQESPRAMSLILCTARQGVCDITENLKGKKQSSKQGLSHCMANYPILCA